MSAEIEKEKQKIIGEWLKRATDDLESAELIIGASDNYEISAYHSHQAIEKLFKAELLKKGETFKFIHDLNALFVQVFEKDLPAGLSEKISFVNSLYPMLRYPTGDSVTNVQAGKCLAIAKEIFSLMGQ